MDFPDNNFLLKTLTVVSGPDMVDLTFHNFVSYKENVGKVRRRVCGEVCGAGLGLGTWGSSGFLQDRPGLQGVGASMCDQGFSLLCSGVLQSWAEDVLALVKHPLTANASRSTFLDKM